MAVARCGVAWRGNTVIDHHRTGAFVFVVVCVCGRERTNRVAVVGPRCHVRLLEAASLFVERTESRQAGRPAHAGRDFPACWGTAVRCHPTKALFVPVCLQVCMHTTRAA